MKKTDVLLDLLPDPEPDIEVAHDIEEKEEKEEIEQGPIKVKRSKKTSDEDEDDSSKLWQYAKYAAIAGFAVIIVEIIIARHRRKKTKGGPDLQEMMMLMMYQMMMMQMQNMQNQQNHKETTLPPQVATDDGTSFSTDWSEWFEKNKGKEINKFGTSETRILNKMHVAENWRVRRDLNGKILDVNKTNEYIR